jgi:hypothetical protein
MAFPLRRWIVAVVLAGGCYRSSPPPAPVHQDRQASYAHARSRSTQPAREERGVIGEAIARLGELTDQMCTCADRTCADTVSQEMTRWSNEVARDYADLKPTDEEMEEVKRVAERLSRCMTTAMSYGHPPPPPSPPPPSP